MPLCEHGRHARSGTLSTARTECDAQRRTWTVSFVREPLPEGIALPRLRSTALSGSGIVTGALWPCFRSTLRWSIGWRLTRRVDGSSPALRTEPRAHGSRSARTCLSWQTRAPRATSRPQSARATRLCSISRTRTSAGYQCDVAEGQGHLCRARNTRVLQAGKGEDKCYPETMDSCANTGELMRRALNAGDQASISLLYGPDS